MVYLVMGLPGTGKTFFAKTLAEKLDASHYNSDAVRAENGLMGSYDPESKEEVYRILLEAMMNKARQGEDVVIDATFVKKELRERFIHPLEKEGIPFRLIRMVADREVIAERVQKERPDSEAGIEVYDRLYESFDPVDREHSVLDSGKLTIEEMLGRILEGTKDQSR
ncbi:MAG: AAA family ATPase [Flavobacteriales bacterium]